MIPLLYIFVALLTMGFLAKPFGDHVGLAIIAGIIWPVSLSIIFGALAYSLFEWVCKFGARP